MSNDRYKIFVAGLLSILILSSPAVLKAATVKLVEIDGVIHPASSRYIQRAITEANEAQAEALLIQMDTPGGLMESMRDIVKAILTSDVPVIVYVAPSGSRAGSAGVFITLAAHVAAMAPGTNIGAAHPVTLGVGQSDDTTNVMADKIVNDAVAYIRSIAERRGRNADWAETAVRESASITETEALTKNVIDMIAPSVDSLLVMLDGREIELPLGLHTLTLADADLEKIPRTWRDQFLEIISDPNIAYILMMLGIYGLFFELYNPGTIVPGVIGGICIILAFFAFQTLPINVAGLLLIFLALILFLLEIKVVSYGVLTIGGAISLILGSVMLIESPIPGLEISWGVILPAAIGTILFFLVAISLSIKAQKSKPTTGVEGMIDQVGEVIEELGPSGRVKIRGEIWQAKSGSGTLPVGSKIKVTAADQSVLTVVEYTERGL